MVNVDMGHRGNATPFDGIVATRLHGTPLAEEKKNGAHLIDKGRKKCRMHTTLKRTNAKDAEKPSGRQK